MILKEADDKTPAIEELRALMARPGVDAATRKRIEQEIKNIQSGARAESDVAYDLRAYLGESKNWMVMHDLRLEIDGVAFQIDHILANRMLDFYVCESKNFSEGVAINEHGEFARFFGGKPYGLPSPIEQNRRHIALLERLLKSGAVDLPTRLGFALRPNLKSLVLVSRQARISRPKKDVDGLDQVLKSDQLALRLSQDVDSAGIGSLASSMAKIVAPETLRRLCEQLVALHAPISVNWAGKFGLPPSLISPVRPAARPAASSSSSSSSSSSAPAPAPAQAQALPTEQAAPEPEKKAKQKLACLSCLEAVPYNVAKFCWFNKPRFGGGVYCVECQKKVASPAS